MIQQRLRHPTSSMASPFDEPVDETRSEAHQRSIFHWLTKLRADIRAFIDQRIHQFHCPYCFAFIHRGMKHIHEKTENKPGSMIYQCESCDANLPADFFASYSSSIAVVGGTDAGKSSFITLFCELLLNRKSLLEELGLFGSIINQEGRLQFEDNRQLLIKQEIALNATTIQQAPIVVRLHSKHHKKVTYITLMDSPGEDFHHPEDLLKKHPNLIYAKGIVFLMNPFDMGELLNLIRKENPASVPPSWEVNNRNFEIIENIYQLYLKTRRVKPNRQIRAHTAFCLSRADLLEGIANMYIPPDFDPDGENVNDVIVEAQLMMKDLEELISESDKKLLNIIDKQFRSYGIFPVSPLGKTPYKDGMGYRVKGGVEPKGVLQPIIWILHQTKFIGRP